MLASAAALVLCLQVPAMPGAGGDDFNFGLLGAAGQPLGKGEGLRVTQVFDHGPAKTAGLRAGDHIRKIGAAPFPKKDDPVYFLVDAIEQVTAARKPVLPLTIVRDGQSVEVSVPFPKLGKHSAHCPRACKRCGAMVQQSLQWLAEAQQGDGSWPSGRGNEQQVVAISTLGGLAFLASGSTPGSGPYAKQLQRCVRLAIDRGGKDRGMRGGGGGANWNQVNWSLGYAGSFLGLVYKVAPDAKIRTKLTEIVADIGANQEASGGWAHGPGGPNALNYLELEIMSNYCLLALGLARQAGIEVDPAVIDKGVAYVAKCTNGDGSVSYSPNPGQIGHGDPGRTSGAIVAFQSLGLTRHKNFKKMCAFATRGHDQLFTGHVSPVMHYLAGGMAAHGEGAEMWTHFRDEFRREFLAARRPDGTFAARPTAESKQLARNNDRGMGFAWTTTSYLIIQQLPYGKLKWQ